MADHVRVQHGSDLPLEFIFLGIGVPVRSYINGIGVCCKWMWWVMVHGEGRWVGSWKIPAYRWRRRSSVGWVWIVGVGVMLVEGGVGLVTRVSWYRAEMLWVCCVVYEAFWFFLGGLLLYTILVGVCWVLMLHGHQLLAFFFIHRNNKAYSFVHFLWLVQKVGPFFVL